MDHRVGSICRAVLCIWMIVVAPFAQPVWAEALDGEVILNRDVEVHIAPSADSPVVRKMSHGQTVSFLGKPRRTAFAWIARNGLSLGYVPIDSLDPIWSARAVDEQVALIDRRFVDEQGRLAGSHVVAREIGSNKQGLPRGSIVSVQSVDGRMAQISSKPGRGTKVPVDALQPIIGVRQSYSEIPGEAQVLYLSKFGEYLSPAEAASSWHGELAFLSEWQPGSQPFIYPTYGKPTRSYSIAIGPFSRAAAETLCIRVARRGRDCFLVQVSIY
jgi:hypothetical protein